MIFPKKKNRKNVREIIGKYVVEENLLKKKTWVCSSKYVTVYLAIPIIECRVFGGREVFL